MKEPEKNLENEVDAKKHIEIKDAKEAYVLQLILLVDAISATTVTESIAYEIWTNLKQKYLKVSTVSQILVKDGFSNER